MLPNKEQTTQASTNHTNQLMMMREFTERFGVLMEGQMLQLRLWPFAVYPGINNSRADVDIEGKAIYYYWTVKDSNKLDSKFFFRLNELEKSMRLMMGPTWALNISINGAVIYPVKEKRARKPKSKSKLVSRVTVTRPTKKRAKPRAGR